MRAGSRCNRGRRAVHADKDSSERKKCGIAGEIADGIAETIPETIPETIAMV